MKLKLSTMALLATIAFENKANGIDLNNLDGRQPDNRSMNVTLEPPARGTRALSNQAKPVLKTQSALPSSSLVSPSHPTQAELNEPAKTAAPLRSTRNPGPVPAQQESKRTSLVNPVLSTPKERAPISPFDRVLLSSTSSIAAKNSQAVTITCHDKTLHLPYSLTAQEILDQAQEFIANNNLPGSSKIQVQATNVPQHLMAAISTLIFQSFK